MSIEFNKIQFEQIVGNRDAKHFSRRLTERLLSYDFEAKENPFQSWVDSCQSLWIRDSRHRKYANAAIATRLKEHCDHLEIPFLFIQCQTR